MQISQKLKGIVRVSPKKYQRRIKASKKEALNINEKTIKIKRRGAIDV